MVNRILLSAAITVALTFSPDLAFSVPTKSVPTKTVKKKSTQPPEKVAKKSKSCNKSSKPTSRTRSSRSRSEEVVESSMVPSYPERRAVTETPPLMKVTPQRDGRFLLEPLTPQKTLQTPLSQPPTKEQKSDRVSSNSPKYNTFEPWNFSELILCQANAYKNAPYARGASLANSSATDCSGFVQFIYHGFKIDLPRSSAEQAQVGKVVTRQMDVSKLLPGDLLFFRRGGPVGHAGIYLGEGKMIHASNHRYGVTVTDLRQPYYEGTFEVAKRVFEVKYPR
jgi:cell wall-associated NlpC family hydrolase